VVSEYGSVRVVRPGKYDPGWANLLQGPNQDKTKPYPWEYPWRSGESVWCAFDHGSIAGPEGTNGIIDYFRIPKRAWYWYRNAFANVPPPVWPVAGTLARLRVTADKSTIAGTDARDDVQVLVTVVDAAGVALSNSPPVELSIVSGPGEFPTGPTIKFDEKTDIPIHDGQAAIEFRSYYAGQTVIRATSPGLASGEVTITTTGSPVFVQGQTPAVKPRPYVKFVAAGGALRDEAFGRDKPTRASSEAPGHNGSMANDGSAATSWQATDDDHAAWWQVDLERQCALASAKITLPTAGMYVFAVEVSDDGQNWREAASSATARFTGQTCTLQMANGSVGQYVRVSFSSVPSGVSAGISEFEITGHLAVP
jgi:hypothetical protein